MKIRLILLQDGLLLKFSSLYIKRMIRAKTPTSPLQLKLFPTRREKKSFI